VGAVAAGPDATWGRDFKVAALSDVMSLMPAQIIADLGLASVRLPGHPDGTHPCAVPGRTVDHSTEDPAADPAGLSKFSASINARRPPTGVVA